MKTNTPRTDAEEFVAETPELPCGDGPFAVVNAVKSEFARELERENNRLRASISEIQLIGKFVTVIYRIENPAEWRKANPLNYTHDGLKAIGVSIGDLIRRRDELRTALERIASGDLDAAFTTEIAQKALDKDDAPQS
ncbi:MAG: hypothetical protein LBK99_16585 [Opitutaceae bacterium]|jgi:hypothetical protein|nr:hypothetical protein [Opitutaceae bacterium]